MAYFKSLKLAAFLLLPLSLAACNCPRDDNPNGLGFKVGEYVQVTPRKLRPNEVHLGADIPGGRGQVTYLSCDQVQVLMPDQQHYYFWPSELKATNGG